MARQCFDKLSTNGLGLAAPIRQEPILSDFPTLESERLILRMLAIEDADALLPAFADDAQMRWWSHAPIREAAALREHLAPRIDNDGWRAFAMVLKAEQRVIGMVSVGERRQGGVGEIGYMILPALVGKGLAREGVARFLDHLFFTEGKRRVFADTDPDNLPSRRLLEHLGFQLEGVLREEWETHIGVRDTTLYGLLRREWEARRGTA
ncbi:GNAT family N-acetyltransferase [Sphingomonas sp. CJ99]